MGRSVLVTIDLDSIAYWAAAYGVQLAARLEEDVTVMLVSPSPAPGERIEAEHMSLEKLAGEKRLWLDQLLRQCQREGVNIEIFCSSGSFFDEIIQFIQSKSSVQFVVVGVPRDSPKGGNRLFSSSLKRLHKAFGGEILLVWEKGRVTRLVNVCLTNPSKEKET